MLRYLGNFSSLVLFVAIAFSLQTVDLLPVKAAANQKTCCGRMICLCKHARGAKCDFRQKHAVHQGAHDRAVHAGEKDKTVRWTKAPCHQDAPQTLAPGFSVDYENAAPYRIFSDDVSRFRSDSNAFSFSSRFPPAIDPPPRIALFSLPL